DSLRAGSRSTSCAMTVSPAAESGATRDSFNGPRMRTAETKAATTAHAATTAIAAARISRRRRFRDERRLRLLVCTSNIRGAADEATDVPALWCCHLPGARERVGMRGDLCPERVWYSVRQE